MNRIACRGFTIIELMTVMIIAAILLALAVPSFRDYMAKRRVEGVYNELQTDLQLARSEAVARNRVVRVTFGTGCYVLHTRGASTTTTCTQTTETIAVGDTKIKTVQLPSGSNATLTPQSSLSFVEFDPLRGGAVWNGSGTEAAIVAGSTGGSWQIRVAVIAPGRVQTCSPSSSMPGFQAC